MKFTIRSNNGIAYQVWTHNLWLLRFLFRARQPHTYSSINTDKDTSTLTKIRTRTHKNEDIHMNICILKHPIRYTPTHLHVCTYRTYTSIRTKIDPLWPLRECFVELRLMIWVEGMFCWVSRLTIWVEGMFCWVKTWYLSWGNVSRCQLRLNTLTVEANVLFQLRLIFELRECFVELQIDIWVDGNVLLS